MAVAKCELPDAGGRPKSGRRGATYQFVLCVLNQISTTREKIQAKTSIRRGGLTAIYGRISPKMRGHGVFFET